MKSYHWLIVSGLLLTFVGFAILFLAIWGTMPVGLAVVGFCLIVVGPLIFIGGLVAFLLRRPAAHESAPFGKTSPPVAPWLLRLAAVGIVALSWVLGLPAISSGQFQGRHWQVEGVPAVLFGVGIVLA